MTEAIVLVGGQGTRLRPLTIRTAKPLLPTAGQPFLVHALGRLQAAGIERVLLATSYQADTFAETLGDGSALGLSLEYVVEEEALGTGGAIRNAGERLRGAPEDAVVILNGDILSGADLSAQLALHETARAEVTLHLTEVADARAFGAVPTDAHGRVTAFLEKMPAPPTNRINAGCYVFRRRVVDAIPAGRVVSVERETFPQLLAAGAPVAGYLDDTYWLDVGTPEAYLRASRDLVLGRAPSGAVQGVAGDALVDPSAQVDVSARVGGGSWVGPAARVAAGAVVEGSVVMAGALIDQGAVVRDCAVGRDARVGARTALTGVVVGDGATLGADNELHAGARVWVDAVLAPGAVRFSSDR
jgi:mannose-1-phosphate guanylyltransferase